MCEASESYLTWTIIKQKLIRFVHAFLVTDYKKHQMH